MEKAPIIKPYEHTNLLLAVVPQRLKELGTHTYRDIRYLTRLSFLCSCLFRLHTISKQIGYSHATKFRFPESIDRTVDIEVVQICLRKSPQ